MKYEIIVVGGGHAGCEAALACSRKKHKTLLITGNINNIADAPCNPSIGGPAKGIVVREIDALGGEMGKNTDKSLLQIKMLNTKKGPAVQALRAQIDKVTYQKEMLETLKSEKNLTIKEAIVEDLILENNKVVGIILSDNTKIHAEAVILTTGTYLKAQVLIGAAKKSSGPHGEKPSLFLSNKLEKIGFHIQRLKTGTPPRIEKNSIDFSQTTIQEGDDRLWSFSHENKYYYAPNKQEKCYLTYTNQETHDIINKNLKKSSMYGGYVEGVGPRYCPSIEDKVVRFKDKERHQLFLEPESLYYDDIYLQGFSTSMPEDIQEKMVRSLKGLENAKILKYAYAIEYDAIDPTQLNSSLETKIIENLYTAGQINGTSGYEEAACQGLIAGINASLKLEGELPLILRRDEAYIGVLIDDLVTKGTKEPYRLLTSRAEYRLLLRHDNADHRLLTKGYKIGLISENKYKLYLEKEKHIEDLLLKLKDIYITPTSKINKILKDFATSEIKDRINLYNLLKRNEISIENLKEIFDFGKYSLEEQHQVEIRIKYEGYIAKALKEAKKLNEYENILIPKDICYKDVHNLASEAIQKLEKIRPASIGQALRISGVNPSDISILTVYLRKEKRKL